MKTTEFDYTFSFEPIQNQSTQVTLFTHLEDKRDLFHCFYSMIDLIN